jgi:hypothetical protein
MEKLTLFSGNMRNTYEGGHFYMSQKETSKYKKDTAILNQAKAEREHRLDKQTGALGTDKLMEAGSLKEAAVVFSHEGMKAFAEMFGNSVESAIARNTNGIEQVIERVVERKLKEMLAGATEGLQEFLQGSMANSVEKAVDNIFNPQQPKVENQPIKVPQAEVPKDAVRTPVFHLERKTAPKKKKKSSKMTIEDTVIDILRNNKHRELTTADIGYIAMEKYKRKWHNPSSPINMTMKRYPEHIEKVSHGVYKYKEEKTSPTTV